MLLLLLIQILFQFQVFNLTFIIVLALLLCVAFMSEQNRLFIWTIIGFVIGQFVFMYGDRLLIELHLSYPDIFILNRLLLLFPIGFISYVVFKFHKTVISFSLKPFWNLTFIRIGNWKLSIKNFFITIMIIHLIFIIPLFVSTFPINPVLFGKIIIFSIINGVLVEVLWRGILLTRMMNLVGEKFAVLCTSLSCSLAYLFFGFSYTLCLIFFIVGIILGAMTIRSKSLSPAIVWNTVFTILLVFADKIPLLT